MKKITLLLSIVSFIVPSFSQAVTWGKLFRITCPGPQVKYFIQPKNFRQVGVENPDFYDPSIPLPVYIPGIGWREYEHFECRNPAYLGVVAIPEGVSVNYEPVPGSFNNSYVPKVYYNNPVAGMHLVYPCRNGQRTYSSLYPDCNEPATPYNLDLRGGMIHSEFSSPFLSVFNEPGPGRHPLYRCLLTNYNIHSISSNYGCSDQGPNHVHEGILGYVPDSYEAAEPPVIPANHIGMKSSRCSQKIGTADQAYLDSTGEVLSEYKINKLSGGFCPAGEIGRAFCQCPKGDIDLSPIPLDLVSMSLDDNFKASITIGGGSTSGIRFYVLPWSAPAATCSNIAGMGTPPMLKQIGVASYVDISSNLLKTVNIDVPQVVVKTVYTSQPFQFVRGKTYTVVACSISYSSKYSNKSIAIVKKY